MFLKEAGSFKPHANPLDLQNHGELQTPTRMLLHRHKYSNNFLWDNTITIFPLLQGWQLGTPIASKEKGRTFLREVGREGEREEGRGGIHLNNSQPFSEYFFPDGLNL